MVFQKGQSGNPGGRPKKEWTWAGLLEQVGEEIEPKSGKKLKDLVSKRLWVLAINGNIHAIKELFNRMDGLPVAKQEITGEDGKPIPIIPWGYLSGLEDTTTTPVGSATKSKKVQDDNMAQKGKKDNNGNK